MEFLQQEFAGQPSGGAALDLFQYFDDNKTIEVSLSSRKQVAPGFAYGSKGVSQDLEGVKRSHAFADIREYLVKQRDVLRAAGREVRADAGHHLASSQDLGRCEPD
jgi:hypothetical protein